MLHYVDFEIFREMMGEVIAVKTFVMDKMAAQMMAAHVVFGCDILLCYFHVRDAIRKHLSGQNSSVIFVVRQTLSAVVFSSTEWLRQTMRKSELHC
ncbi:hypothetical protein EG68_12609 [Paragonimus skrjabini miyazakii]|uniref:MULE transposase domain-containing protein n=1 Tax=Paragonimus skrjabini miyazakii TaxID=59628 RepID=A0A8S9YEH7_9TREM|nr:hypothetical protein EG68_12609 [Paragonimus skrjabini miyazakii]